MAALWTVALGIQLLCWAKRFSATIARFRSAVAVANLGYAAAGFGAGGGDSMFAFSIAR